MPKFRSKPVEIEAVQMTAEFIGEWLYSNGPAPNGLTFEGWAVAARQEHSGLYICHTRQGEVPADIGDWIIQESDGSGCYPCKPDVFEAKYEPIG